VEGYPPDTEGLGELGNEDFDVVNYEVLDNRIRELLHNNNAELEDPGEESVLSDDMERNMLRELFSEVADGDPKDNNGS
jgi:hypothetical protein